VSMIGSLTVPRFSAVDCVLRDSPARTARSYSSTNIDYTCSKGVPLASALMAHAGPSIDAFTASLQPLGRPQRDVRAREEPFSLVRLLSWQPGFGRRPGRAASSHCYTRVTMPGRPRAGRQSKASHGWFLAACLFLHCICALTSCTCWQSSNDFDTQQRYRKHRCLFALIRDF
jgi:hypothetical protein